MDSKLRGRPLVPVLLAGAMLALVIVAAFTPDIGAIPTQTSCSYGVCPSTGTSSTTYLILVLLLLLVIAAIVLLLIRRRRGGGTPPGPAGGPMSEWSGPAEGEVGAAAGAAAYTESPEDVGAAPLISELPESDAGIAGAGVAAGAAGAAAAAPEADIDSLMQELDKISGEILKRSSGKKGGPPSVDPSTTENP